MDLLETLPALLSHDNGTRRAAEQSFSSYSEQRPFDAVKGLFALLCDDNAVVSNRFGAGSAEAVLARSFSAVLLRRLLTPTGRFWRTLDMSGIVEVRALALSALVRADHKTVLRRASNLAAQCASGPACAGPAVAWAELLPAVRSLLSSGNADAVSAALLLCEELPLFAPDTVCRCASELLDALSEVAKAPACAKELRLEAMRALLAVLSAAIEGSDSGSTAQYAPLAPLLLSSLSDCIAAEDGDLIAAVLGAMSDLATTSPLFYRPIADALCGAMIACCDAKAPALAHLSAPARSAALELVLVLSEAAPAMVRRVACVAQGGLVDLCISLLAGVPAEDEETRLWCAEDYSAMEDWVEDLDDATEELALAAEEALERRALIHI